MSKKIILPAERKLKALMKRVESNQFLVRDFYPELSKKLSERKLSIRKFRKIVRDAVSEYIMDHKLDGVYSWYERISSSIINNLEANAQVIISE